MFDPASSRSPSSMPTCLACRQILRFGQIGPNGSVGTTSYTGCTGCSFRPSDWHLDGDTTSHPGCRRRDNTIGAEAADRQLVAF